MASNSNNSSWLEAYEAQKAKALQKMKDNKKAGQQNQNVSGLSGYSGCVQAKDVSQFTKKTNVTKLLNDLKDDDSVKTAAKEAASGSGVDGSNNSEIVATSADLSKVEKERLHSEPKTDRTTVINSIPNRDLSLNEDNDAVNSNSETSPSFPSSYRNGGSAKPLKRPASPTPLMYLVVPAPQPLKEDVVSKDEPPSEKKKKSLGDPDKKPNVQTMLKQVKCDAKRDAKDWQREYEERKKAALAKLAAKK